MTSKNRLFEAVFLLFISLTVVSATIGYRPCRECLSLTVHDAPGVGFDLTADYGVSSVNFYNGTIKDLVKVNASREYKDLMLRLSSAPKPQPSKFESSRRQMNKQSGLPSAEDVNIISDLILRLKNATEADLGLPLDTIVLAHMRFPGLTAEDIGDAVEYAGLHSWMHLPNEVWWDPDQSSENRAALAAHGVNLCQEVGGWSLCMESMGWNGTEEATAYFVSLTNSALYTSIDRYLQPFQYTPHHEWYSFDIGSGLESMASYDSEEAYWRTVSAKPKSPKVRTPITHVLIGGEAGNFAPLREALRDALENAPLAEAYGGVTSAFAGEPVSPLYAAARGAALLARWRQEAPMGCWEHSACKERRGRGRGAIVEGPLPASIYVAWT
ncbi:hypothetical protein Slin15195_G082260 [Septoria linicola]|uniref:Uncharacterized protein n=1 Tax=Septoria linicola TaxID=215465 RepID=A0A9Q9ASC9_9PEZI|nr:hypothetical protein Slin15195_G082260 [Septoria linicola]